MIGAKTTKLLGSKVKYWVFNADKNQVIIMVHGFRGTHHGLQKIIDALPNYRIIVPDLPGFGSSTPMQTKHDIAGYVAFLRQFIPEVTTQPPVLLGHSFGSIVAAELAAASPKLITKLVLINPIATPALQGPRTLFTQLARLYYWLGHTLPEKPGRALLANKRIVLTASALMAKTKNKQLRKAIHQSHLQHFSTFQNRAVLAEAFDASITQTAADHAEHITMPTLLIAGTADDIAPPRGQYELEKRLPNAQLIMIPHVGHLIHHEATAEAAAAIKEFLTTN